MEIKELQQRVDAWIKTYGVRYFSELTNMAVLTEEVGELARVVARKYGDQSFKEGEKCNLAEEMADVLWVLACLANQTGVDLTEAIEASFAKKQLVTRNATKTTKNYKNNQKTNFINPILPKPNVLAERITLHRERFTDAGVPAYGFVGVSKSVIYSA